MREREVKDYSKFFDMSNWVKGCTSYGDRDYGGEEVAGKQV